MWAIRLILACAAVHVALAQRGRQTGIPSASFPRRLPSFPGANLSPSAQPERSFPSFNAPSIRTSNSDRRNPSPRISLQQNSFAAQSPIPRPSAPAQQQPAQSFQILSEDDYDYEYLDQLGLDDPSLVLDDQTPSQSFLDANRNSNRAQSNQNQNVIQSNRKQNQIQANQQTLRPLPVRPRFQERPQAASPIRNTKTSSSPKDRPPIRSGTPVSFRQEFNLQPNANDDDIARGQREPEVKIVKSWSNREADGTFSWGYINTDGSFKNETKGVDCVVRGVYGYVDKSTGETLSFPYVSGNPCDPNAPDYYYDYDEGTINSGGEIVQKNDRHFIGGRP